MGWFFDLRSHAVGILTQGLLAARGETRDEKEARSSAR